MAFFRYFSSNIPDFSASLNVQYLPVDHLFNKLNFHVLQQSLKHSKLFSKGQYKPLDAWVEK